MVGQEIGIAHAAIAFEHRGATAWRPDHGQLTRQQIGIGRGRAAQQRETALALQSFADGGSELTVVRLALEIVLPGGRAGKGASSGAGGVSHGSPALRHGETEPHQAAADATCASVARKPSVIFVFAATPSTLRAALGSPTEARMSPMRAAP